MGKLNIKEDPAEKAGILASKYCAQIDAFARDGIIKYLKEFEPSTLKKMTTGRLSQIETEFSRDNDLEKFEQSLNQWLDDWMILHKRLTSKRQQKDLIEIHNIAKKLKISKFDYRNILMQTIGKQSAAEMFYYEVKLAMRSLYDFSQGKLKSMAWDKNLKG